MKKIGVIAFALTLLFVFSACGSTTTGEKEPENTVDQEFLSALEASVISRMGNSDTSDYAKLVNTELAYLETYYSASFSDSRLQELAKKYIDGVYLQRDALDYEYFSDYQVKWNCGYADRCEALAALYNEYAFMEDNKEFVGSYVYDCEYARALADAYIALEEDIGAQFEAKNTSENGWYGNNDYLCGQFVNNTKYTFSGTWDFKFVDAENDQNILTSRSCYVENIKPGESYLVEVYMGDLTSRFIFYCSNYYDDIKV